MTLAARGRARRGGPCARGLGRHTALCSAVTGGSEGGFLISKHIFDSLAAYFAECP